MAFIDPAEVGLMTRYAMTSARIPLAFAFQHATVAEIRARAPLPLRLPLSPKPVSAAVDLPSVASPSVSVRPVMVRVPAPSRPSPALLGFIARPLLPTIPKTETVLGGPPTVTQAQRLADASNLDETERVALEIANLCTPEAGAFCLLGLIVGVRGRHAGAGDLYRKALYLEPTYYEMLTHLTTLPDVADDAVAACQLMLCAEHTLTCQSKKPSTSSESGTPEHIRETRGARRP